MVGFVGWELVIGLVGWLIGVFFFCCLFVFFVFGYFFLFLIYLFLNIWIFNCVCFWFFFGSNGLVCLFFEGWLSVGVVGWGVEFWIFRIELMEFFCLLICLWWVDFLEVLKLCGLELKWLWEYVVVEFSLIVKFLVWGGIFLYVRCIEFFLEVF